MAGKKHIHKYYRATINQTSVWACALSNCTHYMPKHMDSFVNGKASQCWKCNDEMVMGPAQMEQEKPICNDCSGASILDELSPRMIELLKQKGAM